MNKTFVLDTNVLLHNAECIESFADNMVILPMAVIEELDNFKSHSNELGRNARQVIRRLDKLRAAERLKTQDLHGHVTLRQSERSTLAAVAAENL